MCEKIDDMDDMSPDNKSKTLICAELSNTDNYLACIVLHPILIWALFCQRGDMLNILLFVILVLVGREGCAFGQCVGIEKSLFDSPYSYLTCTKEVVPDEQVPPDTFCEVRWVMTTRISMY